MKKVLISIMVMVSYLLADVSGTNSFVIDSNKWCLLGSKGVIYEVNKNGKTDYEVEYVDFEGKTKVFDGYFAVFYKLDDKTPSLKCK